jgi:hypothetical protein
MYNAQLKILIEYIVSIFTGAVGERKGRRDDQSSEGRASRKPSHTTKTTGRPSQPAAHAAGAFLLKCKLCQLYLWFCFSLDDSNPGGIIISSDIFWLIHMSAVFLLDQLILLFLST